MSDPYTDDVDPHAYRRMLDALTRGKRQPKTKAEAIAFLQQFTRVVMRQKDNPAMTPQECDAVVAEAWRGVDERA